MLTEQEKLINSMMCELMVNITKNIMKHAKKHNITKKEAKEHIMVKSYIEHKEKGNMRQKFVEFIKSQEDTD